LPVAFPFDALTGIPCEKVFEILLNSLDAIFLTAVVGT
jgi:hypothetical protein